MIKQIFISVAALSLTILSTPHAFADATNPQKADNNPQQVAYYTSGNHGIAGEPYQHSGTDAVYSAGTEGVFQQWFHGTSEELSQFVEGDHSVWLPIGNATDCNQQGPGWTFVQNANTAWGSYLQDGNYCVHTNDYNVQ